MAFKDVSGQTALPSFVVPAPGQTYQIPPQYQSYGRPVHGFIQFDPRLLPPVAGGVPGTWSSPRKFISAMTQGHINRSSGSPTGVPASERVSRAAHPEGF